MPAACGWPRPCGRWAHRRVALAWLMAHPASIMPVVGSGNPARLRAAAEAVRVKFSEADWISVYAASQGHEVP